MTKSGELGKENKERNYAHIDILVDFSVKKVALIREQNTGLSYHAICLIVLCPIISGSFYVHYYHVTI